MWDEILAFCGFTQQHTHRETHSNNIVNVCKNAYKEKYMKTALLNLHIKLCSICYGLKGNHAATATATKAAKKPTQHE